MLQGNMINLTMKREHLKLLTEHMIPLSMFWAKILTKKALLIYLHGTCIKYALKNQIIKLVHDKFLLQHIPTKWMIWYNPTQNSAEKRVLGGWGVVVWRRGNESERESTRMRITIKIPININLVGICTCYFFNKLLFVNTKRFQWFQVIQTNAIHIL